MNAQLAYLSWFWQHFNLHRPLEIVIELNRVVHCTLETGGVFHDKRVVREPPGVPVGRVAVTEHALPWELARSSVRHRLVRRFADRLYQAFGFPRANAMFVTGQLYRQDAGPLGFSVAGNGVWDHQGRQVAFVHNDGSVFGAESGVLRAWWQEGCLLDLAGDTLGLVELATGRGTPDDFLPGRLLEDPRPRVPGGNAGLCGPAPTVHQPATPTGRWTSPNPDILGYFRAR